MVAEALARRVQQDKFAQVTVVVLLIVLGKPVVVMAAGEVAEIARQSKFVITVQTIVAPLIVPEKLAEPMTVAEGTVRHLVQRGKFARGMVAVPLIVPGKPAVGTDAMEVVGNAQMGKFVFLHQAIQILAVRPIAPVKLVESLMVAEVLAKPLVQQDKFAIIG